MAEIVVQIEERARMARVQDGLQITVLFAMGRTWQTVQCTNRQAGARRELVDEEFAKCLRALSIGQPTNELGWGSRYLG